MNQPLPDIALTQIEGMIGTLDWVGMTGISLPIKLLDKSGQILSDNVSVRTFVNIKEEQVKGIHMSRLYILLETLGQHTGISPQDLSDVLQHMLESHSGISNAVELNIEGELLIERPALLSDHKGWKSYPFSIRMAIIKGQTQFEMGIKVAYSSSCPCSAALSRQLLQNRFLQSFSDNQPLDVTTVSQWLSDNGSLAIPHSQRSFADVKIKLDLQPNQFPFIELIDLVESAIKIPVQTVVKREDEQEFARLNGQHQQFCEDAARQLKGILNKQAYIIDYWLQVDHQESLHAHNAVAITTKGIPNGYSPNFSFSHSG